MRGEKTERKEMTAFFRKRLPTSAHQTCKAVTVEPRYFEVPREMEKKFEIAGLRNNRGSVKGKGKSKGIRSSFEIAGLRINRVRNSEVRLYLYCGSTLSLVLFC